jgi:hypothetical protein
MRNATVLSGLVSAGLYVVVATFGLGFLFLFLPSLPIFWMGMSNRSDEALRASLAATLLLAVISGPASALVYLLVIALPAWYMAQEASKNGVYQQRVWWFPLTVIVARLVAAFSFLTLALALYYSHIPGGLAELVAARIREAMALFVGEVDEKTFATMQMAAAHYSFLVFGVFAWMWIACLYLHGWVVCRELTRQRKPARPDMAVAPFPPPNWMISLLLISMLAIAIGSETMVFWGKTSLMVLLLPYFLLGLALLHERTKRLQNRTLLLFCLYLLLAMLPWAAVIAAAYGVTYHVSLLNKYLSSGGNSSTH